MPAVRNVKLCTKDCLCLFVCPTGATDTETGQIDAEKCLDGCRACVDACPSHAITLVPDDFPAPQQKTDAVKASLLTLSGSKVRQEQMADAIASRTDNPILKQFASALSQSNRLMAEDLLREAGYMLPQSRNVQELLQTMLDSQQDDAFPREAAQRLQNLLKGHTTETQKKEKTMASTLDNLMEAFAGESQANRKYLAYSKKAEKEGKLNAAKLFKAASDAETIHALKHFEVAGKVAGTADNLKDAVAGETHEYKEMYPDFVKQAEAEGNKAALRTFEFAMKAEEVHAGLYQEALEDLDETEEVFYYLCPVCGNIEKRVPEKCSICGVSGNKFIKY
jgi:rubrerythrin/NAD-dependent dihydropyrimidine dehydrogenase PreA subunit